MTSEATASLRPLEESVTTVSNATIRNFLSQELSAVTRAPATAAPESPQAQSPLRY